MHYELNSPVLFLHRALHVALGGAFCHVLALVVELFALAETDFDLSFAFIEINRQRYERQPLLAGNAEQPHDLPAVHQQFAHTQRIAVEDIALFVGTDVHAVDEYFPVSDIAPGVLEIDLALPDGLDFRSAQDDTGLDLLEYEVVVVGFAVCRNGLLLRFLHDHNSPYSYNSIL